MKRPWRMLVVLIFPALVHGAAIDPGNLHQLVTGWFPKWDKNRDGKLSLQELDAVIQSPQAQGREAAAATVIRLHFIPGDNPIGKLEQSPPMPKSRLLELADNGAIQSEYAGTLNHIAGSNHSLFLPNDPNLLTFHQGRMGDCYLLGTVGAMVNRNPQSVRSMFQPLGNGSVKVSFASGKIVVVPPVTDAETTMGATTGKDHGIWLTVLEKAYASIVTSKRGTEPAKSETAMPSLTGDVIGHGGSSVPVIELLTGHRAAGVHWDASGDPKNAAQAHDWLAKLTASRRLITSAPFPASGKNTTKGLAYHHLYGVLGYDAGRRAVKLFNPWGNDFTPDGPAGMVNGYSTRHGTFEVPVAEFAQLFNGLVYESATPLSR